jgi:hypothetical protein
MSGDDAGFACDAHPSAPHTIAIAAHLDMMVRGFARVAREVKSRGAIA